MRVIGIDPGTARMGYGIIEGAVGRLKSVAYGVLETPAGLPAEERLQRLFRGLHELIETHRPTVLATEELFFGRNVTTALSVGQARGITLLAAAERGLAVRSYTPVQVKQAVVGYGKAEKHQVGAMVKILLSLPAVPKPDDVADALAVAVCCLQSWEMERRTGGGRA